MAHFAKLNNNSVVTDVIVIGNSDCHNANGQESEAVGIAFCQSLFGANTRWVQTSYNSNMRKNYAGIGSTYDATRDAFIAPQPYSNWILNEETCLWEPPVPMPDDGQIYQWDEELGQWVS